MSREHYRYCMAVAKADSSFVLYCDILEAMDEDEFKPFAQNPISKGRNYRFNQITKSNDALLVQEATSPADYWKKVLSRYLRKVSPMLFTDATFVTCLTAGNILIYTLLTSA
ncbi:hypothetical protein O1611_g1410 [Lasiodiplodia mahajangana]|uniref:Uncharacterized protein n=1 Tax=Lasiodiplodia mahajangana TaxID=1108764 RepID=A0ACC2JXI5_9PEZI|nr:hypothetical protein O1611_g1410 [Lasiodiplodia mahajangana]